MSKPQESELLQQLEQMEKRRSEAVGAIVASPAGKKLVVAGPGTGKTFVFRQALVTCGGKGLALTFIRNLVEDLKVTLSDVADVFTFHGFCKHQMHRQAVAGLREGWDYYPPLLEILTADLSLLEGEALIRDDLERRLHDLDDSGGVVTRLLKLGEYYNAVSHTDLVYRVLAHFKAHAEQIPGYPLIVVDEYQDFSLLETSFLALLASKSPVLIAGDDDQALYDFKNASARYIRELYASSDYEKFGLPLCSRCTSVISESVRRVVAAATANGNLVGRIDKPFECYLPDKMSDCQAHPKIIEAQCSLQSRKAPYVGRYIADQISRIPIEDIRESHASGYSTALVIGDKPFMPAAFDVLTRVYPQTVLKKAQDARITPLDGYRRLAAKDTSRLGWRIITSFSPFDDGEALRAALEANRSIHSDLPLEYRDRHLEIAQSVGCVRDKEVLSAEQERKLCAATRLSLDEIKAELAVLDEDAGENLNGEEEELGEDEPTIICTSLVGAKGLSAAYVFIVGFNNGHLPRNPNAITDEEVCKFLVALSRTRKECHVVSCKHFGNGWLQESTFADWIRPCLERRVVDRTYFRN